MVRKVVFTGTAWSGKTTLIDLLSEEGYATVPEAARMLINEGLVGNCPLPWEDIDAFLEKLLPRHFHLESQIPFDVDLAFLDRGIGDEFGYFKFMGVEPPPTYAQAFAEHQYDQVFLFDTLPGYKQDKIRREPLEMVQRLRVLHEKGYRELGYDVVIVPVMPIMERRKFVLERI